MNWLSGYKTVIIFAVVLVNGILRLFGWGLELPEPWNEALDILLSAIALVLRFVSTGPVGFLKRG